MSVQEGEDWTGMGWLPRPLVPSQVFTGEDVHSTMVTRHTQQGGVLVEIDAVQKKKEKVVHKLNFPLWECLE